MYSHWPFADKIGQLCPTDSIVLLGDFDSHDGSDGDD